MSGSGIELEWKTRQQRIDTKLRSCSPVWQIIPWTATLDTARLTCHAVTEFPTAHGPAHYALFVNGAWLTDIQERGYKLDINWLKDDSLENSDELPEPQDLASEAITELEAVVDDLREIITLLEREETVEK